MIPFQYLQNICFLCFIHSQFLRQPSFDVPNINNKYYFYIHITSIESNCYSYSIHILLQMVVVRWYSIIYNIQTRIYYTSTPISLHPVSAGTFLINRWSWSIWIFMLWVFMKDTNNGEYINDRLHWSGYKWSSEWMLIGYCMWCVHIIHN